MLSTLKKMLFGRDKNHDEVNQLPNENKQEEQEMTQQEQHHTIESVVQHKTNLSLHPTWEESLNQEEKYIFSFEQSSLPSMPKNTMAIMGTKVDQTPNGLLIYAYVRNGTPHNLKLEDAPLALVADNGIIVARKRFDLNDLGEIPPFSDRPWTFLFEEKDFIRTQFQLKTWAIMFEPDQPIMDYELDLSSISPSLLTDDMRQHLQVIANNLPPLKPNEQVNMTPFQASYIEEGHIDVMVFLRNATDRDVVFKELPLVLIDSDGDTVATGIFNIEGLKLRPKTCKPIHLGFHQDTVEKPHADLSNFIVRTP